MFDIRTERGWFLEAVSERKTNFIFISFWVLCFTSSLSILETKGKYRVTLPWHFVISKMFNCFVRVCWVSFCTDVSVRSLLRKCFVIVSHAKAFVQHKACFYFTEKCREAPKDSLPLSFSAYCFGFPSPLLTIKYHFISVRYVHKFRDLKVSLKKPSEQHCAFLKKYLTIVCSRSDLDRKFVWISNLNDWE